MCSVSRKVRCRAALVPGEQSGKQGNPRPYVMEWDKQKPTCSSLRSPLSLPAGSPASFTFLKPPFQNLWSQCVYPPAASRAPDRQCHHCIAVGLFPGLSLGSATQGPGPALPSSRLEERGHLTPEHFPIQRESRNGNMLHWHFNFYGRDAAVTPCLFCAGVTWESVSSPLLDLRVLSDKQPALFPGAGECDTVMAMMG